MVEVVSLYKAVDVTRFHTREGAFIGGPRSFTILHLEALEASERLSASNRMRLYVELEAPFSRGAGYFVEFKLGANCL